jgi:hypothetical protein
MIMIDNESSPPFRDGTAECAIAEERFDPLTNVIWIDDAVTPKYETHSVLDLRDWTAFVAIA